MTLQLYTLPLPRGGVRGGVATRKKELAAAGSLSLGEPVVEDIASEPGNFAPDGVYRGKHAAKMAQELEELGSSGAISTVALFDQDAGADHPRAGYYVVESADTNRERALTENLHRWNVTLRRKGTTRSHRRAVRTTASNPRNDFGNDTSAALIGVPAAASKLQWSDEETGQREPASVASTVTGEFGDVDRFDTTASSYSAPTLLFEIDYQDEEDLDLRVWDTRGEASKTDTDGALAWAKVFDSAHEPTGSLIVDNGLLRLTFDDNAQSLGVEEWDTGTGSWTSVSLGSSDWQLFDTDIRRIGQTDVRARVEFEDPVAGEFCTLTMSLQRGRQVVRWVEPSVAPTPSGLQDLLSPIASTSQPERSPSQTVVARSEVDN